MPTDAHRPLARAVVVSSLGRSWQIMCDHVWLEYNFTHPANTSETANPRYRITGRPLDRTPVETGKFLECTLRSKPDYEQQSMEWKKVNVHLTQEIWRNNVHVLLRRNPRISVHDFKSLWYEEFEDTDLKWIMPLQSISASWKVVPGVDVTVEKGVPILQLKSTMSTALPWRPEPFAPRSARSWTSPTMMSSAKLKRPTPPWCRCHKSSASTRPPSHTPAATTAPANSVRPNNVEK